MTKTVSLNEYTYSQVAVLAGKLTTLASKPISLGMTIFIAAGFLDFTITTEPRSREKLKELLEQAVSPEQFDEFWDVIFKAIGAE